MSWKNNLHPASFNGVTFEVASTSDDIERSKATHQYPFKDGANVIDLGAGPRHVSMEAVFYGPNYEAALSKFLDAVDVPDTCELIHPVFGSMQAQTARIGIPFRAEEPDYTKVPIDFILSTLDAPLFDNTAPSQKVGAVNKAADNSLMSGLTRLLADIKVAVTLPALVMGKISADMAIVMANMGIYRNQLTLPIAWVPSGANYITDPTAFFDDLASGMVARVQTIFSTIDLQQAYSGTPGQALSPISTLIDGTSGAVAAGSTVATSSATFAGFNYIDTTAVGYTRGSLASIWTAPLANLLQSLLTLTPSTSSALPTGPYITSGVASAQGSGVTATQPFLIAHVSIQQTAAVASAAAQVFALAIDNPVLTPNDIQSITNDVRTNINTTITLARATWPNIVDHRPITEPLKALALSVYNAAEQLIQAKPPFTTRTVTTPGNLNLLAFLWYGDYTRADELFRLNPQIVNPNFITAGMVLSCYAK